MDDFCAPMRESLLKEQYEKKIASLQHDYWRDMQMQIGIIRASHEQERAQIEGERARLEARAAQLAMLMYTGTVHSVAYRLLQMVDAPPLCFRASACGFRARWPSSSFPTSRSAAVGEARLAAGRVR